MGRRKSIQEQQEMTVVKSNEMIRRGRFDLSVTEQKIMLYIISKIQPGDNEFQRVEMSIRDFCGVSGIKCDENLSSLKHTIKTLSDKSMWIVRPGTRTETLLRWVEKPEIDKDTDIVRIRLDRDLVPYLLQLRRDFTQYQLINVMAMKSKYAMRLYELLKSYSSMGTYETGVEEIRNYLQVGNEHTETRYFNRDVLSVAVGEINDYTDIEVDYMALKHGRSVVGYRFEIAAQQDDPDHILAKAALSGRRPSRYKRNQIFKETMQQLKIEGERIENNDNR